jgi:hypothetical protein
VARSVSASIGGRPGFFHIQEITMTTKTETIRALNDDLRQNLTVGTAFITAGVAALGPEVVGRIVKTIAV